MLSSKEAQYFKYKELLKNKIIVYQKTKDIILKEFILDHGKG